MRAGTITATLGSPQWYRESAVRLLTALLVAVAVLVQLVPSLRATLIFDRDAVRAGEYWRVVTSSFVHFSWMHLAGDAIVLAIAGWLLNRRRVAEVSLLVLGAAAAAGVAVLVMAPELRLYGGLSGIAHAAVVYAALSGITERGGRQTLSWLALVIVALKLALDGSGVRALAGAHLGPGVVVADVSHRWAIAYALILFGVVALSRGRRVRSAARWRSPPVPNLTVTER